MSKMIVVIFWNSINSTTKPQSSANIELKPAQFFYIILSLNSIQQTANQTAKPNWTKNKKKKR